MNEQELLKKALEFDACLDAKMKPESLPQDDEKMLTVLLPLAKSIKPDPEFKKKLSEQLRTSALEKTHSQPHSLFSIKKLAFSLSAGLVLVMMIILGLPFVQSGLATQKTILPTTASSPIQASASPQLLPWLNPQSVQAAQNISEMFPKARWTLVTSFPTPPATTGVYSAVSQPITADLALKTAEKMDFKGDIFEMNPQIPNNPIYYVVADTARVTFLGSTEQFIILPNNAQVMNSHGASIPFEEQKKIAEKYLQEHNLLNFPYEAKPGLTNMDEVTFTRKLEDLPITQNGISNSSITATISREGKVSQIIYKTLSLKKIGDFPILPAADAWQRLTAGHLNGNFAYEIYRITQPALYQYWQKTYKPGSPFDTYGNIETLKPVNQNQKSLLYLENYQMAGNIQGLENKSGPVHLIGQVEEESNGKLILRVEKWEDSSYPEQAFTGKFEKKPEGVVFSTDEGKTYPVEEMPENLPEATTFVIDGFILPQTNSIYWLSIQAQSEICSQFSESFSFSNPNGSGGGGGGGGGSDCAPGQAPSNEFNSMGMVLPQNSESAPAVEPPYKDGDKIEGLQGFLDITRVQAQDGSITTRYQLMDISSQEGQQNWYAELTGETLDAAEVFQHLNVKVWGTYNTIDKQPTIQIERIEKANPEDYYQVWAGKLSSVTLEGRKVIQLTSQDGQRYILKSFIDIPQEQAAPTYPEEDTFLIEGILKNDLLFGGLPVIQESRISSTNGEVNLSNYTLESVQIYTMPLDEPADLIAGEIKIEKAELMYYEMTLRTSPDEPATTYIQPLWVFSGQMADGHSVRFMIQAVTPDYLK